MGKKEECCGGGKVSAAQIFRALSCQTRVCIVKELGRFPERCVCELVGCCGMGWSTVSHHLSVLKNAGIVVDEKRGQQVFYRIVLPCVSQFIECLEAEACSVEGKGRSA